jgi:hypothetical protein
MSTGLDGEAIAAQSYGYFPDSVFVEMSQISIRSDQNLTLQAAAEALFMPYFGC